MSFSHDAVPDESAPAPECCDRGVLVVLLLSGLLPFLGLLLTGAWSERELAVAGMLLLLAISGIVGTIRRKRDKSAHV